MAEQNDKNKTVKVPEWIAWIGDETKRRRAWRSTIAFFSFGAIVVVFILWGMKQNNMGSRSGGYVAIINGERVSALDWHEEVERLEQMYAPMLGGEMNEAMRKQIRIQARETLIAQEVASQAASKEGIQVSKEELRDIIVNLPYFQKDGKFSVDLYSRAFEMDGRLTKTDFENRVHRQALLMKVNRLFEESFRPTLMELEKEKASTEKTVNIAFAKIDMSKAGSVDQVKPEMIKKALSEADFVKKVDDYYKSHSSEFSQEEEVHATHILIKTEKGNSDSEKAALSKIKEIAKELEKGGSFEAMAKKYSEDPGSKDKGGDLGYFTRNRMVPAFDKVAFSLEVGKVSEPVKTEYGYHLIKVLDKKVAKTSTLEESKNHIAAKLINEENVNAEVNELESDLKDSNFAKANQLIDKLGIKWEETGYFDIGVESVPKVGMVDNFVSEAFKLQKDGEYSSKLIKQGMVRYVIKLKEIKSNSTPLNDEFKQKIASDKASTTLNQWAEASFKSMNIQRNDKIF